MKKLLLVLALFPTLALAQHYHHNHQPHWRYQGDRWYWMVPAIVGGVVVYEATKPTPQPPVIIQTTPSQETCTAWTEIQQPDGKIYRERTCTK